MSLLSFSFYIMNNISLFKHNVMQWVFSTFLYWLFACWTRNNRLNRQSTCNLCSISVHFHIVYRFVYGFYINKLYKKCFQAYKTIKEGMWWSEMQSVIVTSKILESQHSTPSSDLKSLFVFCTSNIGKEILDQTSSRFSGEMSSLPSDIIYHPPSRCPLESLESIVISYFHCCPHGHWPT